MTTTASMECATVWHAITRAGHDIRRDQLARLMRTADMTGVVRGRKSVTTRPVKTPDRRPDLVQRDFRAWRSMSGWARPV